MAGHALKEEESGLLVKDCVWTATSVTCDVLLDVPAMQYITYINTVNAFRLPVL